MTSTSDSGDAQDVSGQNVKRQNDVTWPIRIDDVDSRFTWI